MRQYLFRGKRTDNGEWVYGSPIFQDGYVLIRFWNSEEFEYEEYLVAPESVGQYTGMKEFVMADRSFNKPLFEGDIVEVWAMRSPIGSTNPKSQYDGWMKVRATICFMSGEWTVDYENKYNESLTKLKGKEEDNREISNHWSLYRFGSYNNNEDWDREHNARYKYGDIVKIGNVFENADLLEE
jgi:uncharacterized phage protein (TIGR01671 family)